MLKSHRCALFLWVALASQASGVRADPPAPTSIVAQPLSSKSVAAEPSAPTGARLPAGARAREKEERTKATAEAKALLESADVTKVHDGLTRLARLGGEGVAMLIAERLRRGLPPHLADAAVDALSELSDPRAVPVLLELTLHRRWQLRIKAISALATLRAQSVQSALLYALNDPSAEVRAAAVSALGQVGDQRAVPALRAALEKQVDGAASALGRVGSPRDMEALLAQVSGGDVGRFAPAFEQILIRERFPSEKKLKLISALVRFGSPSATACLLHAQAGLPANSDPRVTASLATAAARLSQPKPVTQGQTVVAAKGATP